MERLGRVSRAMITSQLPRWALVKLDCDGNRVAAGGGGGGASSRARSAISCFDRGARPLGARANDTNDCTRAGREPLRCQRLSRWPAELMVLLLFSISSALHRLNRRAGGAKSRRRAAQSEFRPNLEATSSHCGLNGLARPQEEEEARRTSSIGSPRELRVSYLATGHFRPLAARQV